jgi:hypothetical protein
MLIKIERTNARDELTTIYINPTNITSIEFDNDIMTVDYVTRRDSYQFHKVAEYSLAMLALNKAC